MNDLKAIGFRPEATEKQALCELTEVKTDRSQPLINRIQGFISDVRDPYHFSVTGTDVRIRFTGHQGIATSLASALSVMDEQSKNECVPMPFAVADFHEGTVA